jgi:hypothetical protein
MPTATSPVETPPARRKIGRPPGSKSGSVLTAPVSIRLTRSIIGMVDDWRRGEHDIPSRPAAIRRLVELGFRASSLRDTAAS